MAWLSGFSNRLKLTIPPDNVDSNLTDFPTMIHLSTDSGLNSYDTSAVFDELSYSQRKQIAVTIGDETTQCEVEIEYWDSIGEEAILWAKIPTVYSSVDTDLYFYYDATTSGNTSYVGDTGDTPAQNVWDSNFGGVWHMAQDPDGDASDAIKDSTSNINHGTPDGNMTTGDLVDGKVGKAIDFDGEAVDGDHIDISTITINANTTLSWIAESDSSATQQIISGASTSHRISLSSTLVQLQSSGATFQTTHGVTITDWHMYTIVRTSLTTFNLYIDGVLVDSATDGAGTSISVYNIAGKDFATAWVYYNGVLDEIRFSTDDRSAAWIKADYYSNWDNFIVFQDDVSTGWLSDWAKRIELTIDSDKIDTTLAEFPICLTLSSGINTADVFNELYTVSGTRKIAMTTYDGTSQCSVEIQQWDWAGEEAILWTKVPVIDADEDTTLYLYYDRTKSDNTSYVGNSGDLVARDVWDDNFVGVYHMSQDPMGGGSSIINSAGASNYGTPGGFSNWRSNGSIFTDEYSTTSSGLWTTSHDASGESNWITFEGVECVELVCYTTPDTVRMYKYGIATDGQDRIVVTFRAYFDEIQNISTGAVQMNLRRSDVACYVKWGDDGVGVHDGSSYVTIGGSSGWFGEDEWYTWTLDIDFSVPASATVDIYLDGELKSSGVDCSYTGSFPNTHLAFMQYSTNSARTYIDYAHVGIQFGVGSNLIDGKIGQAIDFDGTDDEISLGTHSSLNTTEALTYEAIFKTGSTDHNQFFITKYDVDGIDYQMELHINYTNETVASNVYNDVMTGCNCNTNNGLGGAFIDNQWHYVATGIDVVYGDGYNRLYMDGVLNVTSSTTISTINSLASVPTHIGSVYNSSSASEMWGILDEIRISNVNRSAAWIKATYYSNWNTLITYGTPESMPVSPTHYYYGYVTENSSPVVRTVNLYYRSTGELIDTTTSSGVGGYYYLTTTISGEHYIVTLDDDAGTNYNALILDKLLPRGIE